MEGSLVAYKVFTNGSTLQASELNENLMQQSIAVFSNAAARTAAITAPVEGQMTYLEDSNRYETYDSSSWVPAFGLSLITKTAFTSTTAVNLENVFSSTFRNYQFTIDFTAAPGGAQLQLRTGGVNNTVNYSSNLLLGFGASAIAVARATTGFSLFNQGNEDATSGYLYRPFLATKTVYGALGNQGQAIGIDGGFHNEATSFSSLGFIFSSAATGVVSIYGMR
jgi:hypothetical protein